MKSVIAFTTILGAAVAQEIAPPAGSFVLGAWSPGSGLPGSKINANGGSFWLGKDPSSSCPAVEGLDCTAFPGTRTVLVGGNDTLSLDVAVPGGQQVYVGPNGALGYTPPHSSYMPTGSVTTGFHRFRSQSGGAPVVMNFQGNSFLACPDATNSGVYQIFAHLVVTDGGNCTFFQMRTYTAEGINAWQY
ncbi:hypothetical protein BJ875DRAFT_382230 [Amylocarpus encephaloides]|uniref:IgE-binding protein n=1 Tax=Amylocarpus encephaloides TaxID=45428 RepID=A0A9P8C490_9HELO|nr:hypothetical protein BJ875DRAFT_382230 [Amylocarpus encephaloides]